MLTANRAIILAVALLATLTVVDVSFVSGPSRLGTNIFTSVILLSVLLFFVWVRHDAKAELKSLQIQNRELKETKGTNAPPPDVSTKEPWLFP